MKKLGQVAIGVAITALGLCAIAGGVTSVSPHPLSWLVFAICLLSGVAIGSYGVAIVVLGFDWE